MGSLQEVTTGLIKGPTSNSYDHPFPQTGGSHPPLKTCFVDCGQTVPDTTVVCIDSLWEHTVTLPSSTIVNPLGALFLQ